MKFGGMVFGFVVVLIGAALLFENLDSSNSDNIIGDYWPVILIGLGFLGWIGKGLRPEMGSMMLMALGGILLTQNLSDEYSFRDLWPALAVAFGLSVIFGSASRKRRKHGFGMKFHGKGRRWKNEFHDRSHADAEKFFRGGAREFEGEYTGSTARVKLGSDGIDLTKATLPAEGATIELDVTLGEYKIRVPREWKIDIQAEVTMGQIEDNRAPAEEDRTGPTLVVGGKVLMGGIDISG